MESYVVCYIVYCSFVALVQASISEAFCTLLALLKLNLQLTRLDSDRLE